jgi:hypothetical protein
LQKLLLRHQVPVIENSIPDPDPESESDPESDFRFPMSDFRCRIRRSALGDPGAAPPQLTSKVPIGSLNAPHDRLQHLQNLQNHWINP